MTKELNFRISSALKDIIGRDLITDDFVAIFELVKNSYDAHGTRVDIIFENIYNKDARIIIKDNGKGMSLNDIIDKWLFVAYSAKRDGTEDRDYINLINKNKLYAGAKGIGRFSCDRLGSNLVLKTKTEDERHYNQLDINWEDFERSLKDDFSNIKVLYSQEIDTPTILSGTILEISNLRNIWDRKKIIALKSSLSKLINPNRGEQEEQFRIFISSEEEKEEDNRFKEDREKVNGEVKNFIFETLKLKTTKISFSISNNGICSTELLEGGRLIYKLTESSKFESLKNIEITLFYLNQSAKVTFAKQMGVSTTGYGNIFLYKNGFRIYPYGEPGEDPLKVNTRYAQGYNRYLGLRNLIGRIEIGEPNPGLKETTSRADGLIKSSSYYELEDAFWIALKRLERYVIDVQKWGIELPELDNENNIELLDLITKLTDVDDIISIEYGEDFYNILNHAKSESALDIITKIKTIAISTNNSGLQNEVLLVEKRVKQLQQAVKEAEEESLLKNEIIKAVESEKSKIVRQNFLLKQATIPETIEIRSIEHHINQATFRVDNYLKKLIEGIKDGQDIELLIRIANNISLENKKISSLINIIRKVNFDTMSSKAEGDLIAYIVQYIENIYSEDPTRMINQEIINVDVIYSDEEQFLLTFIPLEINIILDNFLDNSYKAQAQNATLTLCLESSDTLKIIYEDDGKGIDESIKDRVFEFGFTTTKGSGIGLFHIKQIIEEKYNGRVTVQNNHGKGALFEILINK